MSRKRRNVGTAVATGVLAMGVLAAPAHAVPRTFVLTLTDGQSMTVTVDAAPEVPAEQVPLPPTAAPVASVQEVSPPAATPEATTTPEATPTATPQVTPQATPKPERPETAPQATTRPDEAQRTTRVRPERRPAEARRTERRGAKKGKGREKEGAGDRRARPEVREQIASTGKGDLGPIQRAVPDLFIDTFRIPPFLLPIYQAAGIEYGIRWEVLAAINEIETDYGRNLNISSAGAMGWMQFMPATWRQWGTDGNRDGRRNPYNPVDAIFSAARYLKAAGADTDLRGAIWAYNHADWYVDDVLYRARTLGALPSALTASLTGLADGRFPVLGQATFGTIGEDAALITGEAGAEVVAVNDGRVVRVTATGIVIEDVYGNRYAYSGLAKVVRRYEPAAPAPVTRRMPATKQRLFANAPRKNAAFATVVSEPARRHRRVRKGMRVVAGSVIGRLGSSGELGLRIRPAGREAPWIAPEPILKGWKLLDRTRMYRTVGAKGEPTIGQALLMGKQALARYVLGDEGIDVYGCGRADVAAGRIDRRVLATLAFLKLSGFEPTVSSLQCGHSFLTASGNVSEHSTGNAVDIAAVNGRSILGNQGAGSITDAVVRRLLTLQGTMQPHQIISLMDYTEADNTFAMGDHADHIHIGFRPQFTGGGRRVEEILEPQQWERLARRLGEVRNPVVGARRRG